jgi:ubiquinone/menaquinone biosynthesis C-methylase UbiE
MRPKEFNQVEKKIVQTQLKPIYCFDTATENIDHSVVESFGEEWKKFGQFSDAEINHLGKSYFDIIDDSIVNKNTYGIDIGCGTGRFTKYLASRIGFMEVLDPSDAIFTANNLLNNQDNVRFIKASTDNIPFKDETFDFAMSIGVLHHIPNTQKAMNDCVKKVKKGGYFYTYLYYSLDDKSNLFRFLFSIVNFIRGFVCKLPMITKKFTCDVIAIFIYMPIVILGRIMKSFGLKKLAERMPLSMYQTQTFFIIRNDSLDRFGTSLEQRFSKSEIIKMMENAGLENIIISKELPYWHAIGQKRN